MFLFLSNLNYITTKQTPPPPKKKRKKKKIKKRLRGSEYLSPGPMIHGTCPPCTQYHPPLPPPPPQTRTASIPSPCRWHCAKVGRVTFRIHTIIIYWSFTIQMYCEIAFHSVFLLIFSIHLQKSRSSFDDVCIKRMSSCGCAQVGGRVVVRGCGYLGRGHTLDSCRLELRLTMTLLLVLHKEPRQRC